MDNIHPHYEACLGCALTGISIANNSLHHFDPIMAEIVLLTGCILGIHGVVRIVLAWIKGLRR